MTEKRCSEFEQELTALVLDDLSGEERSGLLEHLSTCSECRQARATVEQSLGRLDSAGSIPTSATRRMRVASAILAVNSTPEVVGSVSLVKVDTPKNSGWPRWMNAAGWLAACVLFGIILINPDSAISKSQRPGEVGRVDQIKGEVSIWSDGEWSLLQDGGIVRRGDRIKTQRNASGVIVFGSKSEVAFSAQTLFSVPQGHQIELDYGRVRSRKVGDALSIQTAEGRILQEAGMLDASLTPPIRSRIAQVQSIGVGNRPVRKLKLGDLLTLVNTETGSSYSTADQQLNSKIVTLALPDWKDPWFSQEFEARLLGANLAVVMNAEGDEGVVHSFTPDEDGKQVGGTGWSLNVRVLSGFCSVAQDGEVVRLTQGSEESFPTVPTPVSRASDALVSPLDGLDRERVGALQMNLLGRTESGGWLAECVMESANGATSRKVLVLGEKPDEFGVRLPIRLGQ